MPRDHSPDRPPPGILFLHGMGESGSDGSLPLTVGLPLEIMRAPKRWPHVVVIPQKPDRHREWIEHRAVVIRMLDMAIHEYGIDEERVHLTGLSQGGGGCWAFGALDASRWATVTAVCGYAQAPLEGWAKLASVQDWASERNAERVAHLADALRLVPSWAIHGEDDPLVPSKFSVEMISALRARGADARLTMYPSTGHECWTQAYTEPQLGEWFGRSRRR